MFGCSLLWQCHLCLCACPPPLNPVCLFRLPGNSLCTQITHVCRENPRSQGTFIFDIGHRIINTFVFTYLFVFVCVCNSACACVRVCMRACKKFNKIKNKNLFFLSIMIHSTTFISNVGLQFHCMIEGT